MLHLALYLLIVNAITFALYALDKHASRQRGAARTPEYVLLLFGSPAAHSPLSQRSISSATKRKSEASSSNSGH